MVSLTKLSASARSLKYQFNNDGAVGHEDAVKSSAELIADCEPGPLRNLLVFAADAGPPAWDRLMYGPFLSVSTLVIANLGESTSGPPISAKLDDGAPGLFLVVSSDGRGAGWAPGQAGIVELRYQG